MESIGATTIWMEKLSLSSLGRIFRISIKNKGVVVRFWESSPPMQVAIKAMAILNLIPFKIERIDYSLGDLWIGKRSMGMEFQFALPAEAHKALQVIKERKVYKSLGNILPEEKLDVFFEKEISEEIHSLIKLLLIARWHKEQNNNTSNIILYPNFRLISAVKQIWPDDVISLVVYKSVDTRYIKKWLKLLLLHRKLMIGSSSLDFKKNCENNEFLESKPKIAIHYAEGIDLEKRSDIFWYQNSKIDPKQTLIYFDLNKSSKEPIPAAVFRKLEKMSIRGVALQKKAVDHSAGCVWKDIKNVVKNKINIDTTEMEGSVESALDKWVLISAKNLIADIEYWVIFYKFFNIKIVVDISVQTTEAIAQNMALDFVDGLRIGIQRSTLALTQYQPFFHYNSNQVYFVWGEEASKHRGTSKIIKEFVVSGYPFDSIFSPNPLRDKIQNQLNNSKVKLTIALFDNIFKSDSYFSREMMVNFYRSFLEWLIEDKEIAIIVKEKKPLFLNRLTEIGNLAKQAKSTGRYIRLDNALGRFPSDASFGADFAVGIGISSAVTEAVISGCRGIHCDLPKHYFHPFYEWGHQKVIFDDISKLIKALKRYKENSANEPSLGDWSSHINIFDPFRDGKGSKRMGTYIYWLLDSFNKGKARNEAMQYANRLYKEEWSKEKTISRGSKEIVYENSSY